jgi:threonine dehydrogenase-like Zn-dependent dehydrogenase
MRAVRNAPPTVEVVEVDEPVGDGELVRVATTGICASDLNYLTWGSTQIAGHEFAGTLEDGSAVAVEAIFGCGVCTQCDEGNYNHCERGVQGLGMTDPGAMCEWFRVPRRALVPLPPGLNVKDAFLVEPASVARHACHMGRIGADTRVAVVGAGAIGILAAASAQTIGAPDVAVEARHTHQHEARERLGAGTPTGVYDVVLETAGSESGIHRAMELARPGGTVVHLGVYGDITWPLQDAFMKEVALRPSLGYCGHGGRREFDESADMLVARPELAKILVTHRFPIEDAPDAFRVAEDRHKGVFRVAVEP